MLGRARSLVYRWRRALAVATALGITYCGIVYWRLPRIDPAPAATPDLVIALSSGVEEDSLLDGVGAMRLATAIGYAKSHAVPLLVTTRVQDEDKRTTSDRDQRRIVDSLGWEGRWETLPGVALTTRDEG